MRADESPAARRMLHLLDGAPGARLAFPAPPGPPTQPEPVEPAGLAGPPGLAGLAADDHDVNGVAGAGPRLAMGSRPAQAAAVLAVLGLIACAWFALRPGPDQRTLPPRSAGAFTVPGTQAAAPAAGLAGPAGPGHVSVAPGGPASGAAGASSSAVPGSLSVYVVGQVRRPGVVTLPPGSRVVDAVDAAGGATARADLAAVNLARKIADGEQIVIPRPGQAVPGAPGAAGAPGTPPGGSASGGPAAGTGASGPGSGHGVINLNTATETQLDELPGVGPVIAGRIVSWRQENGPFTRVDQLADVEGIGDATLAKLRALVSV